MISGIYTITHTGNGKLYIGSSVDYEKRISDALKGVMVGNKNHFFGRKHSEETKEKISNALKGENNPAKRPEVREKIRLSRLGKKRGG